jgi:hypothetical protein
MYGSKGRRVEGLREGFRGRGSGWKVHGLRFTYEGFK